MPFDKIVGIDWSGAIDPRPDGKVQVAEYDPANRTVRLVGPRRDPAGAWSREDVFEYVQQQVALGTVLIGLDFAFSYPYCHRQAYFPVEPGSQQDFQPPQGFQQLWETVEQYCNGPNDLYGGPFYRDDGSPFTRYHRYPGYRGDRFENRHRLTDQEAGRLPGLNPTSVFHCIGPNQVGPGSISGMRLLHRIQDQNIACIWPFDVNDTPDRSTVVEIYPSLFLRYAKNAGIPRTVDRLGEQCAHFGADLRDAPRHPTGDQRDALVSAAGMGWFARQAPNWQVPACAATHEGWIFGVSVR